MRGGTWEEENLGPENFWSWRTTETGHQTKPAGMQWLEGQGTDETQAGDTCSQLGTVSTAWPHHTPQSTHPFCHPLRKAR